ncbi:MAG: hypothetical protein WC789_04450 [Lentisphaeria bacterium]|jgi:hypothetical protein
MEPQAPSHPQPQHQDIKSLLKATLPVVERMLASKGDFPPLGAALYTDNRVRILPAVEEGEMIPAEVAVTRYRRMFRNLAASGRIRAAVVYCNEFIEHSPNVQNSDAICAELDHVDGYSADYLFPYRKTPEGLKFGETFGVEAENRLKPTVAAAAAPPPAVPA